MVTIWATHMGPRWANMGPRWGPDAPVSIFHLHHGAHLGPIWVWKNMGPYGTHMGPIWDPRIPYEDPYGTHMVSMYTIWDIWDPYGAPYWYVRAKRNLWAKKLEISVSCMHYTPKSDTDSALISLILIDLVH